MIFTLAIFSDEHIIELNNKYNCLKDALCISITQTVLLCKISHKTPKID